MSTKIGIAFSGGGARGIMHLGVLKALNVNGIYPDVLSGSSAGAIIAAFYAGGFSVEEILKIFKESNVFGFSNFNIKKHGLFNMKKFEEVIKKYFSHDQIKGLGQEIFITITDIQNGKAIYLNHGKLSEALTASSAIPFIFQPVAIEHTLGIDGGVIDNLPIEPLKKNCTHLIASYCNSIQTSPAELNAADIIDRSIHLSMQESIQQKAKSCDLYFEAPGMSQYSIFDLKKADEIFNFAYEYCLTQQEKINAFKKLTNIS